MGEEFTLFPDIQTVPVFPSTRYQGSKQKFIDWIWMCIKHLKFDTALDAFGGTGCVAYRLKQEGKAVVYNDILSFNSVIGKALIENETVTLSESEVDKLLENLSYDEYPHFIENTFKDVYFTDEENRWLDMVSFSIRQMDDEYKQALAYFALFQSCIIKRPYNLFHRKNLYVRFSDVKRNFGNKTTWDTPFEVHFRKFVQEANQAVFSGRHRACVKNGDALKIEEKFDLVYIDTPYLNESGVGVDYADFYHFLNGLLSYDNWAEMIDYRSKHLRLLRQDSVWNDASKICDAFTELFSHYGDSIMVVSYRSNGSPTIECLVDKLTTLGKKVSVYKSSEMKYVLSNKKTSEVLIIAE